jgi:hypothetical protein
LRVEVTTARGDIRLVQAVLVIADVSGYTSFIRHRAVSLVHAEAIITELLESVLDRASHPLIVNKLEGDAALLYSEVGADPAAAVRDAVGQAAAFFEAFAQCLDRVREARRNCTCDACANIDGLALKAFVHVGEIAIKPVRQFEELAGEPVILLHRLLKNHVPVREYVLLSEPVRRLVESLLPECEPLHEDIEGLDAVTVWWLAPDAVSLRSLAAQAVAPVARASADEPIRRTDEFQHLPRYHVGRVAEAWDHAAIWARRWFNRP